MAKHWHLFEGYGIELEYMIVDKDHLGIKPIADLVLRDDNGEVNGDLDWGAVMWSNELVNHVLELKSNGPASDLPALEKSFQQAILKMNEKLETFNAQLMPTAMHPTMTPDQMKLWQHDNGEIYALYNTMFNCQGHGWSNVQSTHINLPFHGDEEFAFLYNAIRVLMPLIPAIAASSPICESELGEAHDMRLLFYSKNQKSIPVITALVVPDVLNSEKEYEYKVLKPIGEAIADFNKDNILDPVWINSRGAMARFDRGAVEIRTIDIQECPKADLAIARLISYCLIHLKDNWSEKGVFANSIPTDKLAEIMMDIARNGGDTLIHNLEFLKCFNQSEPLSARDLWKKLWQNIKDNAQTEPEYQSEIDEILKIGSLSDRILRSLNGNVTEMNLKLVYRELCSCLSHNQFFAP